jgi:hypothetical protein
MTRKNNRERQQQVHKDGQDSGERMNIRGENNDAEDIYQGDRDVMDEGSPINFEVVDISPGNMDILSEDGEEAELSEDAPLNILLNEESATDPVEAIKQYAKDEGVIEEFQERQAYAQGGGKLLDEFQEYHSLSPELSGGDVDAAWDEADQSGEEAVGGSNPTPDQDIVEDLGRAAGLLYQDDEPLNYDKVAQRDRERWELNANSALDGDPRRRRKKSVDIDSEEEPPLNPDEDMDREIDIIGISGVRGAGSLDEDDFDEDEVGEEETDIYDTDYDDELESERDAEEEIENALDDEEPED